MKEADIETCIRNYLTSGEFNHEAYHPARDFLSGLLDITIVKPVIEFFTGTDPVSYTHLIYVRGEKEKEVAIRKIEIGENILDTGDFRIIIYDEMIAVEGAVSYTHLDVYKRQMYMKQQEPIWIPCRTILYRQKKILTRRWKRDLRN